ncbi:hypothetical protein B0H14DRAFT_3886793 [Mycena olivaceomarginata]|nr:hypothetical protein B0H14DRAFT_3886793 [Mycena olivaceomarginata]
MLCLRYSPTQPPSRPQYRIAKQNYVFSACPRREAEINDAWGKREREMRAILLKEFEARETAVAEGEKRLAAAKTVLEDSAKITPFNDLMMLNHHTPKVASAPKASARRSTHHPPSDAMTQFSPMRSIILTATGEALATPSLADSAAMTDLRKFRDEVENNDDNLEEEKKSKSNHNGTGDFMKTERDAREGQPYLRPANHRNMERKIKTEFTDGEKQRKAAQADQWRILQNRADPQQADTKGPIFTIQQLNSPRELKKILKRDLQHQYQWLREEELRSGGGTEILPLSEKSTKADLAKVIVDALERCIPGGR